MKKALLSLVAVLVMVGTFACFTSKVAAQEERRVKKGVWIGITEEQPIIDLSGMTLDEIKSAMDEYMGALSNLEIKLIVSGGQEVSVTPGQLGLEWVNQELIEDAVALGTEGDVISRYKAMKDLEHSNKVYPMELDVDLELIHNFLVEQCVPFDQPAINMSLRKEGKEFFTVEGKEGYALEVDASTNTIYNFFTEGWSHNTGTLEMAVTVLQPLGSEEELAMVRDVLGSFKTSFATSNENRSGNVINGCQFIDGLTLYPGEEFSMIETAGPFGESNGYFKAGAYINGKSVDSFGGGICQVSTTLYKAVLEAELDVTKRYNHSMTVSYVEPSQDAAIASSSGKDFKFVNNTEHPIYIEGYTTKSKQLVFKIYGVETRDPSRTVEYVTEILEETDPGPELVYIDNKQPLGYIDVQSKHIGYKAKLWKVVKVDGVEVSRELVNTSKYKASPRSATVGVVTNDPTAYNEIMAAVGTQNINHVKTVLANLLASQATAN